MDAGSPAGACLKALHGFNALLIVSAKPAAEMTIRLVAQAPPPGRYHAIVWNSLTFRWQDRCRDDFASDWTGWDGWLAIVGGVNNALEIAMVRLRLSIHPRRIGRARMDERWSVTMPPAPLRGDRPPARSLGSLAHLRTGKPEQKFFWSYDRYGAPAPRPSI